MQQAQIILNSKYGVRNQDRVKLITPIDCQKEFSDLLRIIIVDKSSQLKLPQVVVDWKFALILLAGFFKTVDGRPQNPYDLGSKSNCCEELVILWIVFHKVLGYLCERVALSVKSGQPFLKAAVPEVAHLLHLFHLPNQPINVPRLANL